MMTGTALVAAEYLRFGLAGLSALLAVLAYGIVRHEQARPEVRPEILWAGGFTTFVQLIALVMLLIFAAGGVDVTDSGGTTSKNCKEVLERLHTAATSFGDEPVPADEYRIVITEVYQKCAST